MDILEFVDSLKREGIECTEEDKKKFEAPKSEFSCETGCDSGTPDDSDSDNCDSDGCY